MIVKSVEFIGSFQYEHQCPKDQLPEYAFIGRSNVGKSSLINMLTNRKEIARISSTPGKTQTINYFLINEEWYMVDLPGYGYAKVSKKIKAKWKKDIEHYLKVRKELFCVFSLVDSRIPLQKIDLDFINWMGEASIPFSLIFTKIDKIKPKEVEGKIQEKLDGLLEYWESLPEYFLASAVSKAGKDEILAYIASINKK